jgi:membrane-bound lytic murein transglycosylase B
MINLTMEEFAASVAEFAAKNGVDFSDPAAFEANLPALIEAHLNHQRNLAEWAFKNIESVTKVVYREVASK